jgi:hypothetical protein
MKMKTTAMLVLFVSLTTGLLSCNANKRIVTSVKTIAVDQAFKKVYDATQAALKKAGNGKFGIESIDLTFKTTTTTTIEGGVKLWVLSGTYSNANAKTYSTTWSFAKDNDVSKRYTVADTAFVNYVSSVIVASQKIESIDDFGLKEFQVDVDFTVTNTGVGNAEIALSPVTPSITGTREKGYEHSISIKFSKKKS